MTTADPASPDATEEERMMNGAELIAAERQRQIDVEGWTAEHDDKHGAGQLALAAVSYLLHATVGGKSKKPPQMWPWQKKWWKPGSNRVRRLVKAGALIAAEIDRLQRAATA